MEATFFTRRQRRQVRHAAGLAEDLTGGFYCIPGREWPRFPYDVITLADGPGPAAPAFADVVQVVRAGAARTSAARRGLYRIRLRDDEILSAVGRGDVRLFPLLLYVLTHELVHVVRFASGLASYDAPDRRSRDREEARVHTITRKVLEPADDPALRRVSAIWLAAAQSSCM